MGSAHVVETPPEGQGSQDRRALSAQGQARMPTRRQEVSVQVSQWPRRRWGGGLARLGEPGQGQPTSTRMVTLADRPGDLGLLPKAPGMHVVATSQPQIASPRRLAAPPLFVGSPAEDPPAPATHSKSRSPAASGPPTAHSPGGGVAKQGGSPVSPAAASRLVFIHEGLGTQGDQGPASEPAPLASTDSPLAGTGEAQGPGGHSASPQHSPEGLRAEAGPVAVPNPGQAQTDRAQALEAHAPQAQEPKP